MPSTLTQAQPTNWVHYTQNILNVARTAHMDQEVPEGAPDDVTPESLLEALIKRDPYEKRLKSISDDSLVAVAEKGKQSAWVVRLHGDKNEYQSVANAKKKVNYGVVVVRSL